MLACGFILWVNLGRIQRIEYVSSREGRAEAVDVIDPASPTGYAHGQREMIVPLHNNNTYHWIAQTQQMFARGEWRVHWVDYDNAPFGREVSAASPYRWWLGLVAWVDHAVSGRPLGLAVEKSALVADPLLQLVFLAGTVIFVRRKFGAGPAAWFAAGVALVFPFAAVFVPGAADDHGLVQALAVWAVLPVLAGLAAAPGSPAARRWFQVAGVLGGVGMWISVTGLTPILGGIALGALAAAGTARVSSSEPRAAPPWRAWSLAGATTILLTCLLEYYPAHLGSWRLQTVHPLYGLAWLGAGELLHRAVTWIGRGKPGGKFRDIIVVILAVAAVAAVPVVMQRTHHQGFLATDPSSFRLAKLPGSPAQTSLWAWLLHDGITAQAWITLLPVLAILPAVWLAFRRSVAPGSRAALALVLGPVLVAIGLGCWQLSWWGIFDGVWLVLVAVLATMLGEATVPRFARWSGGAGLVLVLGLGATQLLPAPGGPRNNELNESEFFGLIERDLAHWLAKHAGPGGAVVLAPPKETTTLFYYGGLRGLGTLSAEDQDGVGVAIRIVSASTPEEARELIARRGVTHIVIPSWDPYLDEFARIGMGQLEGTFLSRLHAWRLTPWLRPVAYQLPSIPGFEGQTVTIFAVVEDQEDAQALSRIAEYFLEMGELEQAGLVAQALRRFPADLGAWVARAEVESARGDAEGLAASLKVLLPRLKSGADRVLPWERRVGLAVVLARSKLADPAREQARRCFAEVDETRLRALSTGSLYRLQVLGKAFGLTIADPRLRELARNLLPVDLQRRL